MKIKKVIYTLTIAVASICSVAANCAEPTLQTRFICEDTVACGPSVKVEGNKITLDRSLITKLAKKPSLDVLEKNLWEVVYFVNIADREAMSVAIDLIVMVDPHQVNEDDHAGIRPLARALTQYHFWEVLATKPLPVRKKIINYLDVNKSDYTMGSDYEEEKQKALSANYK